MSEPGTDILIDVAGSAIGEVLKSVLHGLGKAKDWFRAAATEHDPFGIVARRYAERMQERYGSMRIFGMARPMSLSDIYVRVNLLPKVSSGHRSSVEALEHFFDRDQRHFGAPRESVDGLALLAEPRMKKSFVLGKPGAGKTTFLKWLALQALARQLPDRRIPLFVSLKDWADSNMDLQTFAVAEFDSCGFPDADAFVQRLLETGGFLILLDGLDEITGDVNKATADLRRFTAKYPDNRFVISCRIAAYNYVFEQFVDVEMADFTPEQIKRFAEQWFAASPAKSRLFREKLAEAHNAPIRELASTPLLLTMFCLAFDELMDFPRNRADLYGEAIDALLKKWDASRNIRRDEIYKNLSPRYKQDLLSVIASQTFPRGQYFVPQRDLEALIADYIANLAGADLGTLDVDSEAVLKSIQAQHGLLVERAQRIFSFSHLTLQEFFMARSLATARIEYIDAIVRAHLAEPQWREVFLLLAEMLRSADGLLLAMRRTLSEVAKEAMLAQLLWAIEKSGVLLEQQDIPRHVSRMIALAFMGNTAWAEPAIKLLRSLGYTTMHRDEALRELLTSRVFDADAARETARTLDLKPVETRTAIDYFYGTQLIVDCLNSEAYVTAALRKSLFEGLCLET